MTRAVSSEMASIPDEAIPVDLKGQFDAAQPKREGESSSSRDLK